MPRPGPAASPAVREISGRELAAKLEAGAPVCLLDVREPWEHQLAALPGSVLVPLGELAARAPELDHPAGALVVTYCHHGVRSLSAAALLAGAGIPDVVSLAGGIDAWSREIDPTVPRY
jgi:rhodanese-related sulfurtransferase